MFICETLKDTICFEVDPVPFEEEEIILHIEIKLTTFWIGDSKYDIRFISNPLYRKNPVNIDHKLIPVYVTYNM